MGKSLPIHVQVEGFAYGRIVGRKGIAICHSERSEESLFIDENLQENERFFVARVCDPSLLRMTILVKP